MARDGVDDVVSMALTGGMALVFLADSNRGIKLLMGKKDWLVPLISGRSLWHKCGGALMLIIEQNIKLITCAHTRGDP